jgi:hypothetical protein
MTVDAQVTAPTAPGSPGMVGRPRTTAADLVLATLGAS